MGGETERFRRRVIAAFKHETNSETGQGWQAWFAGQLGVNATTVWRWAHGRSRIAPSALALLARMERDHPKRRTA